MKHYKIKDRVQVYHVDSGLNVGIAFKYPADAKAFLEQIPAQCDVSDIQHHQELIEILRDLRSTFIKPKRVLFETKEYKIPNTQLARSGAYYFGVLEEITLEYGAVRLEHNTSSKYERESGYNGLTLCVHIPSLYTVGIGHMPQVKDQIKLWTREKFTHVGNGLFVSACGKFKTQSHNKVQVMTDTP